MHFYNSTSVLQRRVVFGLDKDGITQIATDAAKLCKKLEPTLAGTNVRYEYSPESFTGTEVDYAIEICAAVSDVIEPDTDRRLVLNLPATVEMYTPNIYGDVIEYFHRNVPNRDRICLSLHPHNDQGTGVAAAQFGIMAGADRVEGTLFGNGERTGNVDVINIAMNLFSQGVDPELDISDIDALRRVAEYCNRLPGAPAAPLRGRPRLHVVLGQPPGRHQEGLRGARLRRLRGVGRARTCRSTPSTSAAPTRPSIRVNSQSGKGGVAYLMKAEHGLDLPRRLQIEFSKTIQTITEDTGTEIPAAEVWLAFEDTYLAADAPVQLLSHETTTGEKGSTVTAQLIVDGEHRTLHGAGTGPLAAFVAALQADLGIDLEVVDYSEHAVSAGTDATAAAYVETQSADGEVRWGVGLDESILTASLRAVVERGEPPPRPRPPGRAPRALSRVGPQGRRTDPRRPIPRRRRRACAARRVCGRGWRTATMAMPVTVTLSDEEQEYADALAADARR